MPYPERVSTAKLVNFSLGTIELRMCENSVFLVPVKYTLVCYVSTLAVLGHMTHCHVYCMENTIYAMPAL